METKMMYRVKLKNGRYTAWSFDKERTEKNARFFDGKLECKVYKPANPKGLK